MKQKVAIVGQGNVGSALARGLERAGHDVRTVGHDPAAARETAGWANIVILAVPYAALDSVVIDLGRSVDGKVLVDVTNALTADHQLALGFTTSVLRSCRSRRRRRRWSRPSIRCSPSTWTRGA